MILLGSLAFLVCALLIFAEEDRARREKRVLPPAPTPPAPPARLPSDYEAYLADIRATVAAQNRR